MSRLRKTLLPFVASASVLLVACGGGDAANDSPGEMVDDAVADVGAAVDASVESIRATLNGAAERPAPVTTTATGDASLMVYADSIVYIVNGTNLMGVTAAHIHRGGPEEAGPPVATLYTSETGTDFANGTLSAGSITRASTLMGDVSFDTLREMVRNGNAYVNVHTKANPSGEIRGQTGTGGMM